MIYSVLYGHLNDVYVKSGQKVVYGEKLAKMGNTGEVIPKPTIENQSAGTHLHLSVVEGVKNGTWTLDSMPNENVPNKQECLYFIENDIFNNKDRVLVTAGWLDYQKHYAYDVILQNRKHYDLYWNRSFTGTVADIGYNDGYGNYIIINYDTTEIVERNPLGNVDELTRYKNIVETQLIEITEQKRLINNQTLEIDKHIEKINELELAQLNNSEENTDINEKLIKLTEENNDINEKLVTLTKENNDINEKLLTSTEENKDINEKLIKLTEERNILLIKLKEVEEGLNSVPSEMPKLVFECLKTGIYTIRLKKGYKVYIKN